jgi:membrane associated rhomboid family serine protease
MLLLPIGDEPNAHVRTPYVTWGLIGLNVAVFLMTMQHLTADTPANQAFYARWGYDPAHPRLDALFTHMFLHAGWMHLIGNMLFLWIFGDNVESRLGHVGFLVAYLGTGLAATLTHAAFQGGLVVGASGAVSGVEGLYLVACPGARVRLLIWFYVFLRIVVVPAWVVVGAFFVLNDLLPVLLKTGGPTGDGVAHWAHIGGLAAGLVTMLILVPFVGRNEPPGRLPLERRYPHRAYRYEHLHRRHLDRDDDFA